MNIEISVVIPCFNAEEFIERAVLSALGQEGCRCEILVIDDGSTDGSRRKISELAAKDARVRLVVLGRNQGVSNARNKGIELARGEWIAMLDADDIFLPNRLERLLKLAKSEGADVVIDNLQGYDIKNGLTWSPKIDGFGEVFNFSIEDYVSNAQPFAGEIDWGLLKPVIKRSFLKRSNVSYDNDISHGEDVIFMFNILKSGARGFLLNKPGYLYTLRNSGWSRTVVNYERMAADSKKLAEIERLGGNETLARLLEQRALNVEKLSEKIKVGENKKGTGKSTQAELMARWSKWINYFSGKA